jgi:glyoxylase-like metal-dependent hydrolase (beta-lactamase superfamily II)
VDCGAWTKGEHARIDDFLSENGIKLKYSLQTHMHFDHCIGLGTISEQYGLTPMCHPAESAVYQAAPEMVRKWFRIDISDSLPEVETSISEASVLQLGEVSIQVLYTPGHTPGGVCYYIPEGRMVLTGDTIFRMGIGRTDLPGGNYQQELESISHKIFTLPLDTVILPGHGPESTIGEEKDFNPYIS